MWYNWPQTFMVLSKLDAIELDSIDLTAEVILLFNKIEDDLNYAIPMLILNNDLNLIQDETAFA